MWGKLIVLSNDIKHLYFFKTFLRPSQGLKVNQLTGPTEKLIKVPGSASFLQKDIPSFGILMKVVEVVA